jgi:5-methylcytosine-specific restriction endonuclease McrA
MLRKLKNKLKAAKDRLKAGDSWRALKPGANQRGYSYQWQKERAAFLVEHPLCMRCLSLGRASEARVVDHVTAHNGDPGLFWDRSNWQALCVSCHNEWKQQIETAARYGRR